MNIVIPAAGNGSRFISGGFIEPKPLIEVKGYPLLYWSIKTLKLEGNYTFILKKYENEKYNKKIKDLIFDLCGRANLIYVDKTTRGSAESCLLAKRYINNNENLLITNCDQYINWENQINEFKEKLISNVDGIVTTFNHTDPKNIKIGDITPYSFIRLDNNGNADLLSEKIAISKNMLNGIHYWKHGKDFVLSAEELIQKNITYNQEFYVSLTYNLLINKSKKITSFHMNDNSFHSLGTPSDIIAFQNKVKNEIL